MMFQSSRPVAGARINRNTGPWQSHPKRFNPRAPLPGRASFANLTAQIQSTGFNPRAPLPGRASFYRRRLSLSRVRFNPRAPLPGRASLYAVIKSYPQAFQSSRPVAGARIFLVDCRKCKHCLVSILAPRCRGAHQWSLCFMATS